MKLGIFSDLHSNIYALEVIFNIGKNIKKWICCGDTVGLFPNINEVINRIRQKEVISVKGDHEYYLLSNKEMKFSYTGNQSLKLQRSSITNDNLKFIQKLNNIEYLEIDDTKIICTHYLTNRQKIKKEKYKININKLDEIYGEYDVVLFGHTHLPTAIYGKETIYLNPGSAGFPIDVIKQPSFLIYDTSSKTFQFKHFSIDIENLLHDIKIFGYNQKLSNYLKNGFIWR